MGAGLARSPRPLPAIPLLGGRLAVDFANAPGHPAARLRPMSWEEFVLFLESANIVSPERGAQLTALPRTNANAADHLLTRATRLHEGLRSAFGAIARKERISREWIQPINEILRITEGHDELSFEGTWKLEFIAREEGLEWLLAAIARSAAEIIIEGPKARLRICANPNCSLFFCDRSRTHRRRWCSMAVCGNRHKVKSFARRRASV